MRGGQVLILIIHRPSDLRRERRPRTCTANCDNVIFSWVSRHCPDDTQIGPAERMKSCATRWCLIKERSYYQTHPQQRRIASRRLYLCNLALRNDIFESTCGLITKNNSRCVLMKRTTDLPQHCQGQGTKVRIRRVCRPLELAAGILLAVRAPHHTTKENVVTIHSPLL